MTVTHSTKRFDPDDPDNPFAVEWMECFKCHKRRKQYPDFESQWTAIVADNGKPMFVCPSCWGIHDPASSHCFVYGHDYINGACGRCGRLEVQPSK